MMKNTNPSSIADLTEESINHQNPTEKTPTNIINSNTKESVNDNQPDKSDFESEHYLENNFAGVVQTSSDKLALELNNHLAAMIHKAQLDPLTDVFTDTRILGQMRLALVSSDIISEYALTDLTGLASLNIVSIDNTHLHRDQFNFSLNAGMPLQLQQDLHTNICGEIRSRVGFLGQSMTITGHAKVTNVNVDSNIQIEGQINLHLNQPAEIIFKQLSIDNMVVDYDEITINLDGLGILNRFISPLSTVLSRVLKSHLTKFADKQTIKAINSKITELLPLKFSIENN